MSFISVNGSNLTEVCTYIGSGVYGYRREVGLLQINSGNLAGRYVFADHGFRWHGEHGAYRESYTLLSEHCDVEAIKRAIENKDPVEAQSIAYTDSVSTAVKIQTDNQGNE